MSGLQEAPYEIDDDVVLLDRNDPRPQHPKRPRRRISSLFLLLMIIVSFTDSDGEVIVVDLISDDDEPEQVPVENPAEPKVPVILRGILIFVRSHLILPSLQSYKCCPMSNQ